MSKVLRAAVAFACGPTVALAQAAQPDTSKALRDALAAQRIEFQSVVGVHRTPHHVVVDTHTNPSAGTIVVLTRDLEPVATLPGWSLRFLPGGTILYQRNNVHFAPHHWAELWTWEPATGRDARLYPNTARDSAQIDPGRLDSRLGDTIVVSTSGRLAAFVITFGADAGARGATTQQEVIVACRDVGTTRSRCTERPLAAVARDHPGWSTLQMLDALAGNHR